MAWGRMFGWPQRLRGPLATTIQPQMREFRAYCHRNIMPKMHIQDNSTRHPLVGSNLPASPGLPPCSVGPAPAFLNISGAPALQRHCRLQVLVAHLASTTTAMKHGLGMICTNAFRIVTPKWPMLSHQL